MTTAAVTGDVTFTDVDLGVALPGGLFVSATATDLGDVIRQIDGRDVRTLNELLTVLEKHRRGDTVSVTVGRRGEERTVEMELLPKEVT